MSEVNATKWVNGSSIPRRPVLLSSALPSSHLPRLYASAACCGCVVQCSRGEGWGLPAAEAIAMAAPTAATNWSGSTAFLHNNAAFLIPVQEIVDVDPTEANNTDHHHWALPSVDGLRKILRYIFENR